MSRLEFMKELASLLEDLPKDEKIEILKYYNGYFDDAGEENEAAIIEELGSPAKVAASVKAGMDESLAEHMEFTEKGVDDEKTVHEYEESHSQDSGRHGTQERGDGRIYREYSYEGRGSSYTGDGQDSEKSRTDRRYESPYEKSGDKDSGWRSIAIVLILLVTFPVWIGLAGGLLGLACGAIGVLVGLCGAAVGCLAGFMGGGIGSIIHGIARMFVDPLGGMFSISVGILLFGIGLLCALLCGWMFRVVFGRLFPMVFHAVGSAFRWMGNLFGGRRRA